MATQLAQRRGMELEETAGDRKASDNLYIKSADYLRRVREADEDFSEPQLQYVQQVFYNEARVYATRGDNTSVVGSKS